jgi:hypothetical protein
MAIMFSESSIIPKYSKQAVGPTVLKEHLCVGCRSSPKISDQLFVAICWILQNNYYMKHVLHLLDDFLVINEKSYSTSKTMHDLSFPFFLCILHHNAFSYMSS